MKTSEVLCKTALSRSGLADYTVNCYVGCQHACRYCYARFMTRFTDHDEEWGDFVDVKVNIADVLLRELPRRQAGRVMLSSVCDGWQPLEAKYQLTRECLRLLVTYGFEVSVLTKSALVLRDLGTLDGKKNVELGMTVTTLDEELRRVIEPVASPTSERFRVLRAAADRGVRVWLFIGPLLPFVSDTMDSIAPLMREASRLPLERIYVDKLNVRWGVWRSLKELLWEHFPELVPRYQEVLFNPLRGEAYAEELRQRCVWRFRIPLTWR
jgi:DNA repair photolyase